MRLAHMTFRDTVYYKIITNDDDEWFELYTSLFDINIFPLRVCELAAKDYFENHDVWETEWPLKISLYKKFKGEVFCRCLVQLDNVPTFWASEIKTTINDKEV